MGAFQPPIDPAAGFSVDPPRRAEIDDTGHRAVLVSSFTRPGGVQVRAPAATYARWVELAGPFAGVAPAATAGRFWFIELTPLPLSEAFRAVIEHLQWMPRFYMAGLQTPGDDGAVAAGDTLITGPTVLLGATLGPFAVAPRQCVELLLQAMQLAQDPDTAAFAAFSDALDDGPELHVLTHDGQPPRAGELTFDVRIGNSGPVQVVDADDTGTLPVDLSVPGSRLRLQAGVPYHATFPAGPISSPELDAVDRWYTPAGGVTTVLCSDLEHWFAERPADIDLPRWHVGNTVEPLLDGIETFARLWEDLQRLLANPQDIPNRDEFGAWMACWAFKDFEMVPGDEATKITTVAKDLRSNGFQIRLLATKLVQFDGTESEEERLLALAALTLVVAAMDLSYLVFTGIDRDMSPEAWTRITLIALFVTAATSPLWVDAIESGLDGSKDVVEDLIPGSGPRYAIWSRYPATFDDNPEASSFPAVLMQELAAVEHIGVWHNKMQLLALPDGGGREFVAYLGGVDINDNRIDGFNHRWPLDYHDVHARLTGPAVADVFGTFFDRWEYDSHPDRMGEGEGDAASNTCPHGADLAGIPRTDGHHIVQIARTIYRPGPGRTGLPFAPNGEATVHESILRAINAAREYIYIEDQFMVPPDSGDPADDELLEALERAGSRCKALIMVFPEGTGDPQWLFGVERRNHLMQRLRQAWSGAGRHFLPMIHTRPYLRPPDRVAARGRTVTALDIDAAATIVRVADHVRVPEAPCWAWIAGELLLVVKVDEVPQQPTVADLTVTRAGPHHTDVWPRAHPAGSPVTFIKVDDVFIHAKLVLIDDTYASIGSVNMNRRSMFHDGEISAQVVPEQLRAARDNPVRSLRCRIWADHLGLPVEAAESELADPLDALPLFQRPRAAGNPLVPFDLLDDLQPIGIPLDIKDPIEILGTVFGGIGQVTGDLARHAVWSTLIDPTSALDRFHDAPPFA